MTEVPPASWRDPDDRGPPATARTAAQPTDPVAAAATTMDSVGGRRARRPTVALAIRSAVIAAW